MPSIPNIIGKTTIKGSRKIFCLVSARKVPFIGFPIAVLKVEVIGCIAFANVINKNILKNIEKQLKKLIHIAVATKMITERSPKNILDSTVGIEFL